MDGGHAVIRSRDRVSWKYPIWRAQGYGTGRDVLTRRADVISWTGTSDELRQVPLHTQSEEPLKIHCRSWSQSQRLIGIDVAGLKRPEVT